MSNYVVNGPSGACNVQGEACDRCHFLEVGSCSGYDPECPDCKPSEPEVHEIEARCSCAHCESYQRCAVDWKYVAHRAGAPTPKRVANLSKAQYLYFDGSREPVEIDDQPHDYGFGATPEEALADL